MDTIYGRNVQLTFVNGPNTSFPAGDSAGGFSYRGDNEYSDDMEELANSRVIGAGEKGRVPGEHSWSMKLKVKCDTLDPFIPALVAAYKARAAFELYSNMVRYGGTETDGGPCYIFSKPETRNANEQAEITFDVRSTDIVE